MNDNVDPRTGVHRVRKKKPKGKGRSQSQSDQQGEPGEGQPEDIDYPQGDQQFQEQNFAAPAIVPNEAGPSGRPPVPPPGFPQPYGT